MRVTRWRFMALAAALLGACATLASDQSARINLASTPEQEHVSEPLFEMVYREERGDTLLEPRIFGGDNAALGEDPWQVALVYAAYQENRVFCGGALIAPDWVLTAAHCVANHMSPQRVDIVEGHVDLAQGHRIGVTDIIVHPDWTPTLPDGPVRNYNDIALLHLSESARAAVRPIGYSADTVPLAAMTAVRVTGWGETSSGLPAEHLQFLNLQVVSNEDCSDRVAHGVRIRPSMLCAGFPDRRVGFCHGDSGGPLVAGFPSTPQLVGVVSRGSTECGRRNVPGVYTRVSFYADWISACIDPLRGCPRLWPPT